MRCPPEAGSGLGLQIDNYCLRQPAERAIKAWVLTTMREGAVKVSLGRRGILHLSTRKASDFAKLCLGLLCDEREHLRLADFALELSVLRSG